MPKQVIIRQAPPRRFPPLFGDAHRLVYVSGTLPF